MNRIVKYSNLVVSSNNAGSKDKPWIIDGCEVDWAGMTALPSVLSPIVTCTSLHDSVILSVGSDVGIFRENKQLLDGIVKEMTGK